MGEFLEGSCLEKSEYVAYLTCYVEKKTWNETLYRCFGLGSFLINFLAKVSATLTSSMKIVERMRKNMLGQNN